MHKPDLKEGDSLNPSQLRRRTIDFRISPLLTRGLLHPTMKLLSQKRALEKLHDLKSEFASSIRENYEHRAKSCLTCDTPGACCLDAHFVNVRITRLEAAAIGGVLEALPNRNEILARVERTIERFDLASDGKEFYACPLFEKGVGCLVHERGKPLPCISHACYENKEDLPPDHLVTEQECLVQELNERTYRTSATCLPLPVAISRISPS